MEKSNKPNHQTGRRHSLSFRAIVAMAYHFGVELNPLEMTGNERAGAYRAFQTSRNLFSQALDDKIRKLEVTREHALGNQEILRQVAEEARSAIFQLTQAFNKGKLDGDEFRTMLESMPPLLEALEEQTGKAREQILEMSAAGKLTPDVLIDAVNNMADVTNRRFGELPKTIGDSLTQLENAFTRFMGQSRDVDGVMNTLGESIDFLTENIDEVGRAVLVLSSIMATRMVAISSSAESGRTRARSYHLGAATVLLGPTLSRW